MPQNSRCGITRSAVSGSRAARRSLPALTVAGLAAAFLATGCSTQDRICGSGEYPVKAVGSTTGSACVADGEEPSKGYVRYPENKVPQHVGDTWDTYWSKVVVDKDGNVVKD